MKHLLQSVRAIAVLVLASGSTVRAASIYADALISSQFVTSFGSGLVTGAPDGGGLFLGDTFDPPAHPGFIVVHFATPLFDGPGADIVVYDVANSANETASISVSADGVSFTSVGSLNAVANTLDIAGLYSGGFSYVKIANSSTVVSIDVDAVQGLNTVPEPATTQLLTGGLSGLLLLIGGRKLSRSKA